MTFSRRRFVSGASALGLSSLFLRHNGVLAAPETSPKRLVLFFTPHGTVWPKWRPVGTTSNFTLPYILEPLNPFKSRLNIIDGVGLGGGGPGAPHTRGPAVLFTGSPLADDGTFTRSDCSGGCTFGWNTSLSVDQEIANRLAGVTPYKSLEFGVKCGGGHPGAFISYRGAAQPNAPRTDPIATFNQLFAGKSLTDTQKARTLSRRLDVLGHAQSDLNRLKGRVSGADWQKLSAHANAVSELQASLKAESTALCTPPTLPVQGSQIFKPWATDRQIDMLVASLACGFSRVASFQYRLGENDGGGEGTYDWLGQTDEHHLTTHDASALAQDKISNIYRWYAQRFAYLLQKLDGIPEGDGTLLDHTLVLWGSEIGIGTNHDISNIPFVMAGGGKAGAKLGQSLKFTGGVLNNQLLVSLCHFMGYADVAKFGSFDAGKGPLPGLL